MTYRVTLTDQAEADLRGIFEYIAFTLRSVLNAANQLDRLESEINSLTEMPERYPAYQKGKWKNLGLRVMPVDNYLVFYIPDRATQAVNVLRVLYGRMDIDKLLGKLTTEY